MAGSKAWYVLTELSLHGRPCLGELTLMQSSLTRNRWAEALLKCGRQRVMAGNMVWQAARYGYGMQRVCGYGYGKYGYGYGSKVWVWNAAGMGMGMGMGMAGMGMGMAYGYGMQQGMGMGMGMARYGYGYGRWVWNAAGYGRRHGGRQQGVVVLTELSLHRPTTTA